MNDTIRPRDGWAHVGCPACGMVTTVPLDRLEPPPWCVHNDRTVVWRNPHPTTQDGAHPWRRTVRVRVTPDNHPPTVGIVGRGFAPSSPNCPKCDAPPAKQVVRQWGIYPGDADVYCGECGAYVRMWNSG